MLSGRGGKAAVRVETVAENFTDRLPRSRALLPGFAGTLDCVTGLAIREVLHCIVYESSRREV